VYPVKHIKEIFFGHPFFILQIPTFIKLQKSVGIISSLKKEVKEVHYKWELNRLEWLLYICFLLINTFTLISTDFLRTIKILL
jgi:hypothetical protein